MQSNQIIKTESMLANWAAEADVVVIGSGFAGLAAPIEARKVGDSVIVCEKRSTCGGNSIMKPLV